MPKRYLRDDNWVPRDSDKLWLFNLNSMLKMGGYWGSVPPLKFGFRKVAENKLVAVDFDKDDLDSVTMVERIRQVGDLIGIEVDLGD